MHKFKKRRPFQLLLTAGLCLGALNSTGAALWLEEPVRPPHPPEVSYSSPRRVVTDNPAGISISRVSRSLLLS